MFNHVSDEHIKREKQKAKDLRKSRWWQNKIAQCPSCYYCHKVMSKEEVTMDHIVPISMGGKSTEGNIAPCCKDCNTKKQNFTPVEWLSLNGQLT